ncbi:efflux RND transporter periplasmic adaptor subunit [Dechloromonas sp. HYN0024]|uniref:efflux RND transporter periplasmic adaptor subunit n=1 Tax=Dechloromonas sp. HYN0024 TaxID=2231055 RepID=UPI000E44A2D5|nr:efflux RND transporter periplasmic adaptor subunit [Dechloromonas sp. HYN0024]AXS80429.1 efflux RND transporter periplasmic adaptor subunit [Dechloromonas sp. HYN0024]
MKSISKILIGVAVVAGLIGGGIWYAKQREAQNPEKRYKLANVQLGDVTQTVSANGTLNPLVLVNVGTQVSGTVKKLYVDFNDKVKAGQKLVELDQSLLQTIVRQSQANVVNQQSALDLAKANEARMKSLLAQEYISRQDYDVASQNLKSAQAQLIQAKAAADKDAVNLSYSVITSPVSGVVVARLVDIGQTVAASFQTPVLIQIAQDLSKMAIDTSFAEADIGSIKEGFPVRFTVDAFPNRSFNGEVQQIRLNPTNQQNVVTYNVRIRVDNPDLTLLPGMTAYVNIGVQKREGALLVPNAALRFKPADGGAKKPETGQAAPAAAPGKVGPAEGGGAKGGPGKGKKRDGQSGTVYVLVDEEIKAVNVQLGITDNRNTEIVGGELKEGDRIITGENTNGTAGKPSSVGMRMF